MFKKYVINKKLFIFSGLGLFGVLVLSFFVWNFLREESPQMQFSVEMNKARISKKCKKWIDQLIETSEPDEYVCTVRARRSQEGASYTVKSQIVIKREKKNGIIKVEVKGSLKNPTRHATEAEFCSEGCDMGSADINKGSNTMEVISQIAELTNSLENQVKETVREAKVQYDEKRQEENMSRQKQRACLGKWHKKDRWFEEFSIEQQVDCKFTKLRSIKNPERRNLYYHQVLKRDLWKLAVDEEDNDFLREGLLSATVDPSYSSSTRSSASLLSRYLEWKRDYALLDSLGEREQFGNRVRRESQNLVSRLSSDYSTDEIKLLNHGLRKNFEEAFARVQSLPVPSTYNRSSVPTIDYRRANESVKDLY